MPELLPLPDTKSIGVLIGRAMSTDLGDRDHRGTDSARPHVGVRVRLCMGDPYHEPPGTVKHALCSLCVLATSGIGVVIQTPTSGFINSSATGLDIGVAGSTGAYLIAGALDIALVSGVPHPHQPQSLRLRHSCRRHTRRHHPVHPAAGVSHHHLRRSHALTTKHGHSATVITIL
jgi:hypothetical protein